MLYDVVEMVVIIYNKYEIRNYNVFYYVLVIVIVV
nr:MAG TPA: hypothetical protein [Caudoviricetes sp.]